MIQFYAGHQDTVRMWKYIEGNFITIAYRKPTFSDVYLHYDSLLTLPVPIPDKEKKIT